jgi:hypothetical protein
MWGAELTHDIVEDDDELHQPEKNMRMLDQSGGLLSGRGLANLGCVAFLILGLIALLYVPSSWYYIRWLIAFGHLALAILSSDTLIRRKHPTWEHSMSAAQIRQARSEGLSFRKGA